MRLISITLIIVLANCFCTTKKGGDSEAAHLPKKKQPNLVFIFSDQQSSDMLGCNGNDQILTPHIDQFAEQGLRFTHCFSNEPICTPFRGMLMSGQYPLHNGCFHNVYALRESEFNRGTGRGKRREIIYPFRRIIQSASGRIVIC